MTPGECRRAPAASFVPAMFGTFFEKGGGGGVGELGSGSVGALRSQAAGGSRPRAVPEVLRCDVSITSEAGPDPASTGPVLAARRLGAMRAAGAWL